MTPQKAAARLRSTIAAGTGSFLIVEKNLYDMGGTDLVTQVLDELDRLREENLLLRKRVVAESNSLENGK
jgi:molybdopterin-guanine dinucleotide biosynthesis protein A